MKKKKYDELMDNCYEEWDIAELDTWEFRTEPIQVTESERQLAIKILDEWRIDVDDYKLIFFITTPEFLANLIINISRKLRVNRAIND